MIKTLLITVPIAMVVGLTGTVLTLFGPNTLNAQYLKFAIMLLLFVVILVGSYWFVMVPPGRDRQEERVRQQGETER
jgi:hypothetical protein